VSDPNTLGVILAGGLARRLGGADKTRIRIGEATIFERTLERLRPQCVRVFINANDTTRFADAGLPVVADSVPDLPGPLAGVLAGLDFAAAQAPHVSWIVSAPGDCPFLPRDLVLRLHQARQAAGAALACAASGGRQHPVIALWPVALRKDLRRALVEEGVHKVGDWSARYARAIAEWRAEPIDPFFNVNTPDDVADAERLAALYPEA
jgi:molybdopterin-guanine dinucleotide biosynthesis protein A